MKSTTQNSREITLTRGPARKNPRLVIYKFSDRPGSVQFFRAIFPDAIPPSITLVGEFAEPKPKLTPEERKARRKAMTPADRLAAMEKRVERMRAKLAAGTTVAKATSPLAVAKGKR